ncbi:MAG: heme ABC exporter ATP-binding protein CcmA [Actinomycetota bacterium]
MSGTMPIVDLESVSVRVGATHILRDVTLSIEPGDAIGIFGGNGAGKTTLLRLIATLIKPAAGAARVFGVDVATDDRYDIRTRIGYVGHTPGLYPEMTLAENLGFVAHAMGIDQAEAHRSLTAVGLAGAADRRAEVCSHGMQRRAEFARVLMTKPDLLLLDEPHSALDADAVDLVDALVGRTLDAGGAAILVSHDKERVMNVATEFREIAGGSLS